MEEFISRPILGFNSHMLLLMQNPLAHRGIFLHKYGYIRIQKSFLFGKYGELEAYVDILNVGGYRRVYINQNPDAFLTYYTTPPTYTPAPNYKIITTVEDVRTIRFGIRWNF
ncbi:MAG: hypothetical protein ACUVUG_05995 [Candidatus Aminicenantia bacterium]